MTMRRLLLRLGIGLLLMLVLLELVVRASGIADVPIYQTNPDLGYIPAPSQTGSFLHRNGWAFNEISMATPAPWDPHGHRNLLLIGNSIVAGGNPYAQSERLGPSLQRRLGNDTAVWPIAAGRWSNVNEATYLRLHPDVARAADVFVWEYMAGGLSQMSAWQGPLLFPDHRPLWSSSFVVRRYLLPRLFGYNVIEVQPVGPPTVEGVRIFNSALSMLSAKSAGTRPGLIVLYPSEDELKRARSGAEWLPERTQVERLAAAHGLNLVDLAQEPLWNPGLYRDGTHPTPDGNAVLAGIIATALSR